MSELSHFCFVSVFLRGTDLQIKQEASHRDAESGDGLALSVNLVETLGTNFMKDKRLMSSYGLARQDQRALQPVFWCHGPFRQTGDTMEAFSEQCL